MSNSETVIATTHLVDQMILTVESLHDNAKLLNTHARKPAILIEHDALCPPIGQVVGGRVIAIDGGHHALVASNDFFPDPTSITLPTGDLGWEQKSSINNHPFWHGNFHHPDVFSVSIDPQNLGGISGYELLVTELKASTDIEFEASPVARRSVLPDPQIIFTLGVGASALWLGALLGKAAGQAAAKVIEKELQAFFDVMVTAVKKAASEAMPINRPVTYVLQCHGNPNLEFVGRSRNADVVIRAFSESGLQEEKKLADDLRDSMNAEFVQFEMRDDGTWKLNYCLTKDGKVIGTRRAFSRRAIALNQKKMPALPNSKKKKK